jgi:hypothetical protein
VQALRGTHKKLQRLQELQGHRQRHNDYEAILMRLGTPVRLMVSRDIERVLPLDAKKTLLPARTLEKEQQEAREDAMIRRILEHGPFALVVLGGSHDLTDNLDRLAPG